MKKIIFLCFIFIVKISNIFNIIIIPYQSLNPLLTNNSTLIELIKNASDFSIINALSNNLIYTEFNVGENIQTVPTFIEMRTQDFVIKDIQRNEQIDNIENKNSQQISNGNYLLEPLLKKKYYNSKLSDSFTFVEDCYDFLNIYLPIKNVCGNETVYMNKKKNINDASKTSQVNFYVKLKRLESYDHRPAIIGLNYYSKFISDLKKNEEINGYDFTFKYTNKLEDKGELIIGDLPYIYDSNNYQEKNMRSAKLNKDLTIKWSLEFDVIISSKKNNQNDYYLELNEISYFYIEEYFITGSNIYFNYIEENFFKKYIENNKCKRGIHKKQNNDNNFFHILCYIDNENERKEFFDEFPTLILYQKEMDFRFKLNASDLFTIIPDGKRILFNIDFTYNSNKWILGKHFFKKYQLFFNSDSNLISYFIQTSDLENNIEITAKNGKGWKIVLIILLIIVAFSIGIIFGRALCAKYNRKIRANELEDNYSYVANDNKKNDNNNDLKGLNIDNNFNLKSKYYNLN